MMINKSIIRKSILPIFLVIAFFLNNQVYAQKEIVLGSHAKKGNSNTSVTQGEGIGMQMNAHKKKVTIKSLQMNLNNSHPDSVKFYLRLFPLNGKTLGNNIMPERIYTRELKENKIFVDLSNLNISISGKFVIGIEWAESASGTVNNISFPTGLFKKGIYYKEDDEERWKKVPLFGFDMIVRGVVAD